MAMSIPRFLIAVLFAKLEAAASTPAHAAGARAYVAEKFSDNRVFAACADLSRLGASLHWSYDVVVLAPPGLFLGVLYPAHQGRQR